MSPDELNSPKRHPTIASIGNCIASFDFVPPTMGSLVLFYKHTEVFCTIGNVDSVLYEQKLWSPRRWRRSVEGPRSFTTKWLIVDYSSILKAPNTFVPSPDCWNIRTAKFQCLQCPTCQYT